MYNLKIDKSILKKLDLKSFFYYYNGEVYEQLVKEYQYSDYFSKYRSIYRLNITVGHMKSVMNVDLDKNDEKSDNDKSKVHFFEELSELVSFLEKRKHLSVLDEFLYDVSKNFNEKQTLQNYNDARRNNAYFISKNIYIKSPVFENEHMINEYCDISSLYKLKDLMTLDYEKKYCSHIPMISNEHLEYTSKGTELAVNPRLSGENIHLHSDSMGIEVTMGRKSLCFEAPYFKTEEAIFEYASKKINLLKEKLGENYIDPNEVAF